jgi:hypothetical protein
MTKISRTKGGCSVCTRGRWKPPGVVLVKMRATKVRGPYTWIGICLVCAKAVAKEIGR